MEKYTQNDIKNDCTAVHCGNDDVCSLPPRCDTDVQNKSEVNLSPSGNSDNQVTSDSGDNVLESAKQLPPHDAPSVPENIQPELVEEVICDSHQSVLSIPESLLTDGSAVLIGVEDLLVVGSENSKNQHVSDPVPEMPFLDNNTCNDNLNEVAGCVNDHDVCSGEPSERTDVDQTPSNDKIECDSQMPETCPLDVELSTSPDDSKQLIETTDHVEPANLPVEETILCHENNDEDNQECSSASPNVDVHLRICAHDREDSDIVDLEERLSSNVKEELTQCPVGHLCSCEGVSSFCMNNSMCKALVVKNIAALVVDEILQVAIKDVLKTKFKHRNVGKRKEHFRSNDLLSCDKECNIQTCQVTSTSEKAIIESVTLCESECSSSVGVCSSPDDKVSHFPSCSALVVPSSFSTNSDHVTVISESGVTAVCNGSLVSPSESNSHLENDSIGSGQADYSDGLSLVYESKCMIHASTGDQPPKVDCSEDFQDECKQSVALDAQSHASSAELCTSEIAEVCDGIAVNGSAVKSFENDLSDISDLVKCVAEPDLKDQGGNALNYPNTVLDPLADLIIHEFDYVNIGECDEQKNEFDANYGVMLNESTDNAKLDLSEQEFSVEAKDVIDCQANSEVESPTQLDLNANSSLSELSVSVEDESSKDEIISENVIILHAPKENGNDSVNVQILNSDERNIPVISFTSHDKTTVNEIEQCIVVPELDTKCESVNCCLDSVVLSKCDVLAQSDSDNVCALVKPDETPTDLNFNISQEDHVKLSPVSEAGDGAALVTDEEKLNLGKVSAVGDADLSTLLLGNNSEAGQFTSQELILEAKVEKPDHGKIGRSQHTALFNEDMLPHLNECYAPLWEEQCEEESTEEAEFSHTASDSESDPNLKISKSGHEDGNLVSYLPLVEEDLISRSTLSLISELEETCVKDLNLYGELAEDELSGLLKNEGSVDEVGLDETCAKNLNLDDEQTKDEVLGVLETEESDDKVELEQAFVEDLNLEAEQVNEDGEEVENELLGLLKTGGSVDKMGLFKSTNADLNAELIQRVKGRRIKHDRTMKGRMEEDEEEYLDENSKKGTLHLKYAEKITEIKNVLKSGTSLERLRELARSEGGLVTDEIRRDAWPLLLGVDMISAKSPLPPVDQEELRSHPEYNQVVLDVNRSLRRFPSKISPEERAKLQEQLTEIILRVLIKRRDLYYYQGYHDVAVTTLLVAGKDSAFRILERISTAFLSDCMLPTMDRTMYLLNYIYPLLQRINPYLAERLDRLEVGTIFCLPWFLTWYGYSLNRYEDVVRVFDYFVASPPLAPLYLAAVVVGRRSHEVLTADFDHAIVHSLLSRIPDTLPLEELLSEASQLYQQYPPSVIESEVRDRCERLRRAQEEEEEQRRQVRQKRMIQRRHSLPVIAPMRQLPGWFVVERFLQFAPTGRFARVSATIVVGMLAWNWRNEMFRYF